MPAAALASEAAFERWRDDVGDWGRDLDARFYYACRWFAANGVTVACGTAPGLPPR